MVEMILGSGHKFDVKKFFVSEVTAVSKEQMTGTVATISCIVAGLTKNLDKVKWTKSDNTDITSGQDGYTIDVGTFKVDSQTTTLTVAAHQNNQDASYNCVITSNELDARNKTTAVSLKVFSKSSFYDGKEFYFLKRQQALERKIFFCAHHKFRNIHAFHS